MLNIIIVNLKYHLSLSIDQAKNLTEEIEGEV